MTGLVPSGTALCSPLLFTRSLPSHSPGKNIATLQRVCTDAGAVLQRSSPGSARSTPSCRCPTVLVGLRRELHLGGLKTLF